MTEYFDHLILGGGAAGFFAAITAKQKNLTKRTLLLEKTGQLLSKVRISGGGRCNVTHSCFDPNLLVHNYPRGSRELLGPFHRFQPRDTIRWFESRGVPLKVEADGRIFPSSDRSSSIIDCLMQEATIAKVEIRLKQRIEKIEQLNPGFSVTLFSGEKIQAHHLCLATGSHPDGHAYAKNFGHTIQEPVPSLFTFNVASFPLADLAGISLDNARLSFDSFQSKGALLITHWGFSGPAALKLSAWAARELHAQAYQITLTLDWLPEIQQEQIFTGLRHRRDQSPLQTLASHPSWGIPKNLWKRLVKRADIEDTKKNCEVSNNEFSRLAALLKADSYLTSGKTTHKEEFVTCGGVSLQEVNFKTMESRICPGLFFAGEILDIDAITGGFNFQNAWTSGWLAGQAMAGSAL